MSIHIKQEFEADSTSARLLPSLVPWPGHSDFNVSIRQVERTRGIKWFYSNQLNKLFAAPNACFPVTISANLHMPATVTIVPIYKDVQDILTPVTRCYTCKMQHLPGDETTEHLVRLEDQEQGVYNVKNGRFMITVPLNPQNCKQNSLEIHLKFACLTTCVGGPSRRPFVLQFTLWQGNVEVGRQIIDVKSCKSPRRDMTAEETRFTPEPTRIQPRPAQLPPHNDNSYCPVDIQGLLAAQPKNFVQITIPAEFEKNVRKYIKYLTADSYIPFIDPRCLPYPEVETNHH